MNHTMKYIDNQITAIGNVSSIVILILSPS